jgi:hypothetical protein
LAPQSSSSIAVLFRETLEVNFELKSDVWRVFVPTFALVTLLVSLFVYGATSTSLSETDELLQRGVRAKGVLLEVQPQQHGQVHYSYTFEERRYVGFGRIGPPNPDLSSLRVGDELYVTLDRNAPAVSCACDPHQKGWANSRAAALAVGPVMGLFMGYTALVVGRRRRSRIG